MTPTLKSSRLTLLPYTAGLVADYHVAWLNDPEVVKYSEQRHKKHTLESQHEYLNTRPTGSHIWLILGSGLAIGTITAYRDEPNKVANVGILIGDKSMWSRGLGSEAWKIVTQYLFDDGIEKIEAGYMAPNRAMGKLAAKVGMGVEALIPQHFIFKGERKGLVMVGMYR